MRLEFIYMPVSKLDHYARSIALCLSARSIIVLRYGYNHVAGKHGSIGNDGVAYATGSGETSHSGKERFLLRCLRTILRPPNDRSIFIVVLREAHLL